MGDPRLLETGELSATLDGGALRWIRWRGVEVLRSLETTVRDSAWGTVSPELQDLTIEATEGRCAIRYRASYRTDEIDLGATVGIELWSDGRLRVDLEAIANSTFRRNRIGLIALHPMDVAGHEATFRTKSGVVATAFPLAIEPDVVTTDLRSLSWDVGHGIRGELVLEGEDWEMEDHRNWTDASFKTYPTPLRLLFPATVEKGSVIRQSVTLHARGGSPAMVESAPNAIQILGTTGPLPALASELPAGDDEPTPAIVEAIGLLGLDFIRATIGPDHAVSDAARIARWAEALGLPIELEIRLGNGTDLDAALAAVVPRVRRAYAFDHTIRRGHDSSQAAVDRVRRALTELGSTAPVGGGTRANFTELNRSRPPAAGLDSITYAVSPQVHAFDEASIVETLQVLSLTVDEARSHVPARPISIVVSLRPRFNAGADEALADPTGRPVRADPRQGSMFAAAWFLGVISTLGHAEVDSIVLAETHGPAGLIVADLAGPKMTPLASLIARINSQGTASMLNVSGPADLAMLGLAGDQGQILIAGDLSGRAGEVEGGPSLRQYKRSALVNGRWRPSSGPASPAGKIRLRPWAIVLWESLRSELLGQG